MAKAVNYTPEQTAELKAAYLENPSKETVETFARKFGKTVKSVVAKLSREGVYRKAEYVSKTGEKPVKKESLVDEFAAEIGMNAETLESLAKANKTALKAIFAELVKRRQMVEALSSAVEQLAEGRMI